MRTREGVSAKSSSNKLSRQRVGLPGRCVVLQLFEISLGIVQSHDSIANAPKPFFVDPAQAVGVSLSFY